MPVSKPFPVLSKKIEEAIQQRHMDIHNERLAKAKSMVDTSEPEHMHTVLGRNNPKNREAEAEKQYQIQAENANLYNKLIRIETSDSSQIIKPSLSRPTLLDRPGIYTPPNPAHGQVVDHINLTATSCPRSIHYRGSCNGASMNTMSRSNSKENLQAYDLLPERSSLSSSACMPQRTTSGGKWTGQLAVRGSHETAAMIRKSCSGMPTPLHDYWNVGAEDDGSHLTAATHVSSRERGHVAAAVNSRNSTPTLPPLRASMPGTATAQQANSSTSLPPVGTRSSTASPLMQAYGGGTTHESTQYHGDMLPSAGQLAPGTAPEPMLGSTGSRGGGNSSTGLPTSPPAPLPPGLPGRPGPLPPRGYSTSGALRDSNLRPESSSGSFSQSQLPMPFSVSVSASQDLPSTPPRPPRIRQASPGPMRQSNSGLRDSVAPPSEPSAAGGTAPSGMARRSSPASMRPAPARSGDAEALPTALQPVRRASPARVSGTGLQQPVSYGELSQQFHLSRDAALVAEALASSSSVDGSLLSAARPPPANGRRGPSPARSISGSSAAVSEPPYGVELLGSLTEAKQEQMRAAYLAGANVRAAGNTVMAVRRSSPGLAGLPPRAGSDPNMSRLRGAALTAPSAATDQQRQQAGGSAAATSRYVDFEDSAEL